MSLAEDKFLRVVLYEGADSSPLSGEDRFELLSRALSGGHAVTRVTGRGKTAPADRQQLLVLGRFANGRPELDGTDANVAFEDISNRDAEAVTGLIEARRNDTGSAAHGAWKPWFPVIDYDRCTNCMQCLSFCLFGVYGVDDEQRIQVQNNDNCKTNCPACSRVCPEAAIMFPKYKAGPINGDVVSAEDLNREKMKVDISSLLGGDVYAMLRNRSERAQTRFSKERDSDKALKERQKCLVKLAGDGDIPPEVLMSLPSPEEIVRRAGEAKAKADAALAKQGGA